MSNLLLPFSSFGQKHTYFNVRITIHELANVPLVSGQFRCKWRFRHAHTIHGHSASHTHASTPITPSPLSAGASSPLEEPAGAGTPATHNAPHRDGAHGLAEGSGPDGTTVGELEGYGVDGEPEEHEEKSSRGNDRDKGLFAGVVHALTSKNKSKQRLRSQPSGSMRMTPSNVGGGDGSRGRREASHGAEEEEEAEEDGAESVHSQRDTRSRRTSTSTTRTTESGAASIRSHGADTERNGSSLHPSRSSTSLRNQAHSHGHGHGHAKSSPPGKQKETENAPSVTGPEPRGETDSVRVRDHIVVWERKAEAGVRIGVEKPKPPKEREKEEGHSQENAANAFGYLGNCELRISVKQEVAANGHQSSSDGASRLGYVTLNLAEFAPHPNHHHHHHYHHGVSGASQTGQSHTLHRSETRRYLLRESKTNAMLKLTIEMEHVGGTREYAVPSLRGGLQVAVLAGLMDEAAQNAGRRHHRYHSNSSGSSSSSLRGAPSAGGSALGLAAHVLGGAHGHTRSVAAHTRIPAHNLRTAIPALSTASRQNGMPTTHHHDRAPEDIIEAIFNRGPGSNATLLLAPTVSRADKVARDKDKNARSRKDLPLPRTTSAPHISASPSRDLSADTSANKDVDAIQAPGMEASTSGETIGIGTVGGLARTPRIGIDTTHRRTPSAGTVRSILTNSGNATMGAGAGVGGSGESPTVLTSGFGAGSDRKTSGGGSIPGTRTPSIRWEFDSASSRAPSVASAPAGSAGAGLTPENAQLEFGALLDPKANSQLVASPQPAETASLSSFPPSSPLLPDGPSADESSSTGSAPPSTSGHSAPASHGSSMNENRYITEGITESRPITGDDNGDGNATMADRPRKKRSSANVEITRRYKGAGWSSPPPSHPQSVWSPPSSGSISRFRPASSANSEMDFDEGRERGGSSLLGQLVRAEAEAGEGPNANAKRFDEQLQRQRQRYQPSYQSHAAQQQQYPPRPGMQISASMPGYTRSSTAVGLGLGDAGDVNAWP